MSGASTHAIPESLRRAHRAKVSPRARIVLEGRLHCHILEPEVREFKLRADRSGVVPHEVEPEKDVSFYVEFHQ